MFRGKVRSNLPAVLPPFARNSVNMLPKILRNTTMEISYQIRRDEPFLPFPYHSFQEMVERLYDVSDLDLLILPAYRQSIPLVYPLNFFLS